MDLKEAKRLIEQREQEGYYKNFSVEVHYNLVDVKKKFSQLYPLYRFIFKELEAFHSMPDDLKNVFRGSVSYFQNVKNEIDYNIRHINLGRKTAQSIIHAVNSNHDKVVTSSSSEAQFIVSLYERHPESIHAAYKYLFPSNENINLLRSTDFNGYIHAFEFRNKGFEPIRRTKAEKPAISRLKNDFQEDLDEYRSRLSILLEEYKSKSENFYTNSKKNQDEFDKETLKWRNLLQEELTKFKNDKIQEFDDLKNEYLRDLRLRTSVKFWTDRAKQLREKGNRYTTAVIVGVAVIVIIILQILFNPDTIPSFGDNIEQAIKWSILLIAAISFMAYVIRAFTKMMFSSYHLARDAEERVELTHSYMSLRNETGELTDEERLMVMQSLFSRAESGLLKDDSSPAMPSDIVSKILKSGSQ